MKIIAIHGVMFLFGGGISLFPVSGFSISGKEVSYYEWWASGVGVLFFMSAASIGIGAVCLLKKLSNARIIYFSILTITLISTPIIDLVQTGSKAALIMAAITLLLFYWYLFKKVSVQNYFDTGNL